ncbi:hypothetical protein RUM43_008145 [Polyplax serrata]|uniref:Uncharacterized protein n=1 Tax=Polyplax serrata TaxID=468196 RepID=A0AAN8S5Z2_POLSC
MINDGVNIMLTDIECQEKATKPLKTQSILQHAKLSRKIHRKRFPEGEDEISTCISHLRKVTDRIRRKEKNLRSGRKQAKILNGKGSNDEEKAKGRSDCIYKTLVEPTASEKNI